MGKSHGNIELDDITLEKIEKFYEFLQGKYMPEYLYMKCPPRLSEQKAFKIIYYMQEIMEILPDKFERCTTCGCIYDSEMGGSFKSLHCDDCRRD